MLTEEKQTFLVFVFPGLLKYVEKVFEPPGVCLGPHHVPAACYSRSQISCPIFSHSFVLARQFGSTGGLEVPKGLWERSCLEIYRKTRISEYTEESSSKIATKGPQDFVVRKK